MVVRHKLINERPFRGNKIFKILTEIAAPSPTPSSDILAQLFLMAFKVDMPLWLVELTSD